MTVKEAAQKSCMYHDGATMFRIQSCMEDGFLILNEDTGDEHEIKYSEVDTNEAIFYELTQVRFE